MTRQHSKILFIKTPIKTLIVALVCLSTSTFSAALQAQAPRFADGTQDVAQVIELIDRRLALMPEVAAWKWRAQQPITDEARELTVIERSVIDAESIGLNAAGARRFFDVQIRMARGVQAHYFARWRAKNAAQIPTSRDLNSELRPLLDAIGGELTVAIYLASTELSATLRSEQVNAGIEQLKRHKGVTEEQLTELRAALLAMHIDKASNLKVIKRVGVLRVGSTGDYAPFSSDRNGELSGFDVQLAKDLAQHWGVRVKFVRTSWPTLMDDFKQHHFDIAMSGISVTPERAEQAEFSTAYHVDGKTPISRCKDAAKFAALEQIDRPEVRVIVNPGGTNERFVRERIRGASIVVHPDNRTVFEEILAGRADVMITDGIEVELQVRRHPKLCGTMQSPLTQAQKAIMLPRALGWAAEVNVWLAPKLTSGQIRERLQQALRAAE